MTKESRAAKPIIAQAPCEIDCNVGPTSIHFRASRTEPLVSMSLYVNMIGSKVAKSKALFNFKNTNGLYIRIKSGFKK